MKNSKLLLLAMGLIIVSCSLKTNRLTVSPINQQTQAVKQEPIEDINTSASKKRHWVITNQDITIEKYFPFIDSVVAHYDTLVTYALTEHLLVRANPQIINTLASTDYYRMIAVDSFVYNQRKLRVLKKGDSLGIPTLAEARKILNNFQATFIDLNIPAYTLNIYQDSSQLYSFKVRVGRNEKKYLKMGNRITDLRTKEGLGTIVRYERNPDFYNPVDGKQFYQTKRDDGRTTLMPQIPWIETAVNGIRNGQMIHPTTNPKSLGKAYSNGCIGTAEADAWIIYYYAPIGTRLYIRYDLNVINSKGELIRLEDIYRYYN